MGLLSKLAEKAEKLAVQALEKAQQQGAQAGQSQQQGAGGYAAPQVFQQQQYPGFSTPPVPPPPYEPERYDGQGPRFGTPPPQPSAPPQEYQAPTTYSPNPPVQGRKKAVLVRHAALPACACACAAMRACCAPQLPSVHAARRACHGAGSAMSGAITVHGALAWARGACMGVRA